MSWWRAKQGGTQTAGGIESAPSGGREHRNFRPQTAPLETARGSSSFPGPLSVRALAVGGQINLALEYSRLRRICDSSRCAAAPTSSGRADTTDLRANQSPRAARMTEAIGGLGAISPLWIQCGGFS